jgi:hypothetical protein
MRENAWPWAGYGKSYRGTYSSLMDRSAGRDLAPPQALRPAQLGVILVGRVTLGHLGATVVDLAGRDYLGIEPVAGDDGDPDWEVTAQDREPAQLLGYERTLRDRLFDGPLRLGAVTAGLLPLLDEVRSRVERDAIRAGWLGRGPVKRLLGRWTLPRPGQGPARRT